MSDDSAERFDPAEQRVRELLVLVGTRVPVPDSDLPRTVVRQARRQRAIVRPLRLLGEFVQAVLTTAQVILRPESGTRDR
jgi:hypothetical protein